MFRRCNLFWFLDWLPFLSICCKVSLKSCLKIRIRHLFNSALNITSPKLGNSQINSTIFDAKFSIKYFCKVLLRLYSPILRYTVRSEKNKMLPISEIRQSSSMRFCNTSFGMINLGAPPLFRAFLDFVPPKIQHFTNYIIIPRSVIPGF